MTDASPAPPPKTRWFREIASYLVLILLVIGLHSLIAKPFYIPSESMMPTLLVGDRLVVSKYPYGWSYISPSFHVLPFIRGRLFGDLPERGDIVILTPSDATRGGEDLIKRVVGLPGDIIEMRGGRLWIDGSPVRTADRGRRLLPTAGNFRCAAEVGADGVSYCRPKVVRETLPNGRSYDTLDFGRSALDDYPPYRVPAGGLFLMGDNRDNSADSRVPAELNGLGGAVPVENIGGRAEFLTFSTNGTATWDPRSWFSAFRSHRAGTSLRPD